VPPSGNLIGRVIKCIWVSEGISPMKTLPWKPVIILLWISRMHVHFLLVVRIIWKDKELWPKEWEGALAILCRQSVWGNVAFTECFL
jgi:hypothetical protein